jgi:N-acetyl-beta-hexosaminidase
MYFDHNQFDEPDGHEYNGGSNPLVDVYAFDPTADYPDDLRRFVKFVQANVRVEFIFDAEDLEWKVFTRAAALVEIAWTINKDWPRFLTGLSRVEIGRLKMRPAPITHEWQVSWEAAMVSGEWATISWDLRQEIQMIGEYNVSWVCHG